MGLFNAIHTEKDYAPRTRPGIICSSHVGLFYAAVGALSSWFLAEFQRNSWNYSAICLKLEVPYCGLILLTPAKQPILLSSTGP